MIIVLHPDAEIRHELRTMLHEDGHRTFCVASMGEALTALELRVSGVLSALEIGDAPAGGLALMARARLRHPSAARALVITSQDCGIAESAVATGRAHRAWALPVDAHSLRAWFRRAIVPPALAELRAVGGRAR